MSSGSSSDIISCYLAQTAQAVSVYLSRRHFQSLRVENRLFTETVIISVERHLNDKNKGRTGFAQSFVFKLNDGFWIGEVPGVKN